MIKNDVKEVYKDKLKELINVADMVSCNYVAKRDNRHGGRTTNYRKIYIRSQKNYWVNYLEYNNTCDKWVNEQEYMPQVLSIEEVIGEIKHFFDTEMVSSIFTSIDVFVSDRKVFVVNAYDFRDVSDCNDESEWLEDEEDGE